MCCASKETWCLRVGGELAESKNNVSTCIAVEWYNKTYLHTTTTYGPGLYVVSLEGSIIIIIGLIDMAVVWSDRFHYIK